VVGGDADGLEELLERRAAAVAADPLPRDLLGLEHARGELGAVVRVVGVVLRVPAGVGQPLLGDVDGMPGGERAAPVEDDRVDGAAARVSHGPARPPA
jgi:hypothetical protein